MGLDQLIQAHFRELCGLLALLTLWLITRLYEEPKKAARVAPTRHSPVTAEELGRTVFSIAGSDDFDAYRVLFLSGSEASQILGSLAAKQYLVRRTLSVHCSHLGRQLRCCWRSCPMVPVMWERNFSRPASV